MPDTELDRYLDQLLASMTPGALALFFQIRKQLAAAKSLGFKRRRGERASTSWQAWKEERRES